MTLDEMRAALGHEGEIAFTPVPRLRARRGGWDAQTQRDFIAALSLCGSVRAAADVRTVDDVGGERSRQAPGRHHREHW